MRIPSPPAVEDVPHLSATVYREMAKCRARGAWAAHGNRTLVPGHPSALLGIAAHRVIEAANRGRFVRAGETILNAARAAFDDVARGLYESSHPLLRTKFRSAEQLPYYSIYRERTAARIVGLSAGLSLSGSPRDPAGGTRLIESRLSTVDGVLVGHPDLVTSAGGEVVDYKNGAGPDGNQIEPAEARQLRFYAALAGDNGMRISKGTIVRADGRRASIDIAPDEARAEAESARQVLADYRAKAGRSFADAADPSPDNCGNCECVPFCERFWSSADPSWGQSVGCHMQGVVRQVESSNAQGVPLTTITVDADAGSCPRGEVRVEQVPTAWLVAGGDAPPAAGDRIRVCYARLASGEGQHVVRVDRVQTAVWR